MITLLTAFLGAAAFGGTFVFGFKVGRRQGEKDASATYREAMNALAEGRPVPMLEAPKPSPSPSRCRSPDRGTVNNRQCLALADPRCDGGNCTYHCRANCNGACLKTRARA